MQACTLLLALFDSTSIYENTNEQYQYISSKECVIGCTKKVRIVSVYMSFVLYIVA